MSNNFSKESKDKALEYLRKNPKEVDLLFCILDDSSRQIIIEQYILPRVIESVNTGREHEYVSFNIKGYSESRKILLEDQK